MADIDRILARNQERLDRLVRRQASPEALAEWQRHGRRLKRRVDSAVQRLTRMVVGSAAVALFAFFWGLFIRPIGFSGVMLTLLAMMATFVLLAIFPRRRQSTPASFATQPPALLPHAVADWLDRQRHLFPRSVQTTLDRLQHKIEILGPELTQLPESDPAQAASQRLLTDHLPRLVERYSEVPDRLRQSADAQGHFTDGLQAIETELDRLLATLGRERLNQLEVEGKFLEQRYQPPEG